MAKKRSKFTLLARVLDASIQPVYFLDAQQTIVYCNQALLDWVGCNADELIGRECRYHSTPSAPTAHDHDTIAARLCPPSEAFTESGTSAIVAALGRDDWLHRRKALFMPLSEPDFDTKNKKEKTKAAGLIAVVEAADFYDTAKPTTASLISAMEGSANLSRTMHQAIQAFHSTLKGRFAGGRFLGSSPRILKSLTRMRIAAGTRVHVIISGPRGSGRQHAAKIIHQEAPNRNPGAIFPVDCAVLGPEIIDATLRTLAQRDPRPENPGRSTLLMIDIDLLDPQIQEAMITLIRDSQFSLRIIGTASAPLSKAVDEGRFRADLAEILTAIEIELPTLAERRPDIPIIAQAMLEEINREGKKQLSGFTSAAFDLLDSYHWPGNLDELYEMILSAHKQATPPYIQPNDLPERLQITADAASVSAEAKEIIELDTYLADVEKRVILRALESTEGNRAHAARMLGLTRARLYRRMEQLGLE